MNNFEITFSPLALEDIEQAIYYYETGQTGLGKRFASQLQLTFNAINRNPFFASVRCDDIRCAQIKKFPYLAFANLRLCHLAHPDTCFGALVPHLFMAPFLHC